MFKGFAKETLVMLRSLGQVPEVLAEDGREFWQPAIVECSAEEVGSLMELWQSCDDEHGRAEFLKCMNHHEQKEFHFPCTAKLWTGRNITRTQVSVNNAQLFA